ncbi:hypothetical protein Zmor_019762 [Zophobas morio]|uniref:Gustatory receptor n=1 Tax=Zophobas morio TaxID=2755281 RepID=A0AA38I262_9CUCU|nr:hypothetical protein Zmor_019762 [Zophobas morio]
MKSLHEPENDIKFIRTLCRYLDFFLITPWYDFSKNSSYKPTTKKIYGCIFLAAKVMWYIYSIKNNGQVYQFYHESLSSQKIGYVFLASALMLHWCLTVTFSTFLSVKHWKILFTNLEKFDTRIKSRGKVKMSISRRLICCTIIQQVMSLLLCFYVLYLVTGVLKAPLWRSISSTLPIEVCYETVVIFLINVINDIIKRRYRLLNTKLVEVLRGSKVIQELENVAECYQILGETATSFNRIFGYQMLIIVFHCGVEVIHCLNLGFVTNSAKETVPYFAYVCNMYALGVVSYNFLLLVLPLDSTTREAKKFMQICYKAQRLFHIDSKELKAVINLTNYSEHFVPEFCAAGFFKINKTLIFSLLGHVAACYIIIIQFNQSQNSPNP